MSSSIKYIVPASLAVVMALPLAAAEKQKPDGEVVVTATRDSQQKDKVPASIGVLKRKEIRKTLPAHPSELASRVPGVHLSVTGGEGHMTAIRQPISTKPLYLYLQDGVPTRSTGFFNHNALYEVNVPQAGSVEILKGPGTALHGSDAIGAVINVRTDAPPLKPLFAMTSDAGPWGWGRFLFDIGNTKGDNGFRVGLNLTHTDGWRDATEYDRQGLTARWDHYLASGASLKTVLAVSSIDQQTAGSSRLLVTDYFANPEMNYTPISYRQVDALRLSMTWEKETANGVLSIIPFFRDNSMDMLPNWSLSYDPVVYETGNRSYGVMVKYSQKLAKGKGRLISGVDIDYSPGHRDEFTINPTKVGNIFTSYTLGSKIYDYDVTYHMVSPYVHYEVSPSARLNLSAGLRYDIMRYEYDNHLSVVTTGSHRRPADTNASFNHLSPKLGATWKFSKDMTGWVSWRHAFRAPSEGQLFRQGRAVNTVNLKPVKGNSIEIGLRGRGGALKYEAAVYYMRMKDDILTYRHPDNTRETMNAGQTSHRGIELGLSSKVNSRFDWRLAFSYAKHRYDDWSPQTGVVYSGNEMVSAPRLMANLLMNWRPAVLKGGSMSLELVRLGSYWMDDANTHKYDGHSLANLRVHYPVNKRMNLFARLMNIGDVRYATAASYSPAAFGNPEKFEYAPGMPRRLFVGLRYRFR